MIKNRQKRKADDIGKLLDKLDKISEKARKNKKTMTGYFVAGPMGFIIIPSIIAIIATVKIIKKFSKK